MGSYFVGDIIQFPKNARKPEYNADVLKNHVRHNGYKFYSNCYEDDLYVLDKLIKKDEDNSEYENE